MLIARRLDRHDDAIRVALHVAIASVHHLHGDHAAALDDRDRLRGPPTIPGRREAHCRCARVAATAVGERNAPNIATDLEDRADLRRGLHLAQTAVGRRERHLGRLGRRVAAPAARQEHLVHVAVLGLAQRVLDQVRRLIGGRDEAEEECELHLRERRLTIARAHERKEHAHALLTLVAHQPDLYGLRELAKLPLAHRSQRLAVEAHGQLT